MLSNTSISTPSLPSLAARPKVLSVDDHHVLLDALTYVLSPAYDSQTVGSLDLLEAAVESFGPDVVVLDIAMPGGDGFTAAKRLLQRWPGLKLVFLSMHGDSTYVRRASEIGAQAFVSKRASSQELLQAIQTVLNGGRYVSPQLQAMPEAGSDGEPTLTERQKQVLQLIACGYSAKEIANDLKISVRTAEFHRAAIMDRLQLHSTAMMTRYAVEQGLA